jgi:hypothetical protein
MKITETELASALGRMILGPAEGTMIQVPPPPDGPLTATGPLFSYLVRDGATIAHQVFQAIQDQRAENERWVLGALYQGDLGGPKLREGGGWFSYDCHEHFRDGTVDTTGFRRLVREETRPGS